MQYFYIKADETQSEAISLDQLKTIVSKTTKVWHQGLDNWVEASEIEELGDFFRSVPPPINKNPPLFEKSYVAPVYEIEESFTSRNKYKLIGGLSIMVVILLISFSFGNKNTSDTEVQTYENAERIEQQKIALEAQQKQIEEQQQIEAERTRQEDQRKADELILELNNAYSTLEKSKSNLNEVSSFKFGRSQSTRDAEIRFAESTIQEWELRIEEIEKEIKKIDPNWGKN